jgi:hypothetical protein
LLLTFFNSHYLQSGNMSVFFVEREYVRAFQAHCKMYFDETKNNYQGKSTYPPAPGTFSLGTMAYAWMKYLFTHPATNHKLKKGSGRQSCKYLQCR